MKLFQILCFVSIVLYVVADDLRNCWLNGTIASCPFRDAVDFEDAIHAMDTAILAPEPHGLVGCWIPKVNSRLLVKSMNLLTHCRQHPLCNCDISDCSESIKYIPLSLVGHCKGVTPPMGFSNSSYLRFVVLRDPITRFLSGYIDKYSEKAETEKQNNFNNVDFYGGEKTTWKKYLQKTKKKPTIMTLLKALRTFKTGDIYAIDHHLMLQTHRWY